MSKSNPKKSKYEIIDTNVLINSQAKLGVYFYDYHLYSSDFEKSNEIRSYCINLAVVDTDTRNGYKYERYELINFYATLKLSDYAITHTIGRFQDEDVSSKTLDYEKLISEYAKLKFNTAIDRLKRRSQINPNVKPKMNSDYMKDSVEFLEFTEDTAFQWSGPFELDDKQGCHVVTKDNNEDAISSMVNNNFLS